MAKTTDRQARLAEALRENLRRRKARPAEKTKTKPQDRAERRDPDAAKPPQSGTP